MKTRLNLTFLISMSALLIAGAQLLGQDIWVGNSLTTSNWTDTANWTNTVIGVPENGDPLVFQGSNRTTNTNDLPIADIDSFTFDSTAASFTLEGKTLGLLENGITNNSPNLQTINFTQANANLVGHSGLVLYDPTTTITAASGPINILCNIEAGRINVFGEAVLTVVGPFTTTISGSLTDDPTNPLNTLALTKAGPGALILTGTSTYTGDTNIDGGVLQVDGSIMSDTFANPGGTLAGFGIIYGAVTNSGIVTPGTSPGTLTISGADYTNNSDGTFRAEIGGLNEGVNADLLHVFGNAFINGGTLEVVRFGNFMPAPGDQVTILRTESVCSRFGTFDTLVRIGWAGLIQPFADYSDPDTVDVVFQLAASFQSQGETPNQESVGEALDEAFSDECLPLSTFTILGNIPIAALPHTYDLIAPEELAAMYEISFSRATVQSQNLQRRMDQIRENADPNCGPIAEINPQPMQDKNVVSKNVAGKEEVVQPAPAPETRWGTFAMGSGDFVTVHDDDGNADGYKIANGSFLGGVDYRLLRSFALGVYGGYVGSDTELNHHGRITTDGGTIGGYATFFTHGFYFQGAGGGTWNEYNNSRQALFANAQGKTNGDELNAMGAAGYDWTMNFNAGDHAGSLTIGPTASIQYTDLDIDGYSEHGSLIPLEIQGHSEDSLRSTIGAKAMICLQMPHGAMLRPEVRVAWLHEYSDNRYSITSRFIGCEDFFRVHGPRVGEDAALVNAGVTIQMTPMLSLFGHYDGIFGRDNYDNNSVSGGLALSF